MTKRRKQLSDKLAVSKGRKFGKTGSTTGSKFEQKFTREKHHVLGRKKSKGACGKPSESRLKAWQNREQTLGRQSETLFKSNAFLDRRLLEKDKSLSKEEKMLKRLAVEKQKMFAKHDAKFGKFRLNNDQEEETLTHYGQSLADMEKFELSRDQPSSDDEDVPMDVGLNFGMGDQKDAAKSRKQVIDEMIAKSKMFKHDKQSQKQEQQTLTDQLDEQWRQIQQSNILSSFTASQKNDTKETPKEKMSDFDTLVRELVFERRTGPASEAVKDKEQLDAEQRQRFQDLEREKVKRMHVTDDAYGYCKTTLAGHFNPDDMDYDFCFEKNDDVEQKEADSDEEENADEDHCPNLRDLEEKFTIGINKISSKKATVDKKQNSTSNDQADFQLPKDAPTSYNQLKMWLDKDCADCAARIAFLETLIKNLAPGLKPGNKEQLQKLFLYLLRYFDEKSSRGVDLKLLDNLTALLFKLKDNGPQFAARSVRALLRKHCSTLLPTKLNSKTTRIRAVPINVLCFLRLVPHLFPVTDSSHPVTTPVLLFMSQIFDRMKPKNVDHVSNCLIFCAIFVDFVREGKKFAPELVYFMSRLLDWFDRQDLSGAACRLSLTSIFDRTCEHQANNAASGLSCLLKCFTRLLSAYKDKPSFPEIFKPIIVKLKKFCSSHEHPISTTLKDQVNRFLHSYNETLSNFSRKKLSLQHNDTPQKDFEFLEPRLVTNFNPDKKERNKLKGAKGERQRLRKQYKNEFKGTKRELRRDGEFLARKALEKHFAQDRERKEKTKRLMTMLTGQEADYKKSKKGK